MKEKITNKICVCDVYQLDSFFDNPCNPKLIRDERRHGKQKVIEQKDLKKKGVCLSYGNRFVLIPMLHGSERHYHVK